MKAKKIELTNKTARQIVNGSLNALDVTIIRNHIFTGEILWDAQHEIAIIVTGTYSDPQRERIEFVYSPQITKYDIDSDWIDVNSSEAEKLFGPKLLWQTESGEMWVDDDFEYARSQAIAVRTLPEPFPIPWDKDKAETKIKCMIADTINKLFNPPYPQLPSHDTIVRFLDRIFDWNRYTNDRETWERFCNERKWEDGKNVF